MTKKIIIIFLLAASLGLSQNSYYEFYLAGNTAENVKNYAAAQTNYEKAIQLEPSFAPAHNALGFVFLEIKEYEKAEKYFNQAIKLKPDFILPIINRGAANYRAGNLAEAQKDFLKALTIDNRNIKALTNMAVVKFKYGDYLGAFQYYTQAKSVDESYLKERYNKEKSLEEIREARKKDPNNIQLKILEEKIINNEIFLP